MKFYLYTRGGWLNGSKPLGVFNTQEAARNWALERVKLRVTKPENWAMHVACDYTIASSIN